MFKHGASVYLTIHTCLNRLNPCSLFAPCRYRLRCLQPLVQLLANPAPEQEEEEGGVVAGLRAVAAAATGDDSDEEVQVGASSGKSMCWRRLLSDSSVCSDIRQYPDIFHTHIYTYIYTFYIYKMCPAVAFARTPM